MIACGYTFAKRGMDRCHIANSPFDFVAGLNLIYWVIRTDYLSHSANTGPSRQANKWKHEEITINRKKAERMVVRKWNSPKWELTIWRRNSQISKTILGRAITVDREYDTNIRRDIGIAKYSFKYLKKMSIFIYCNKF